MRVAAFLAGAVSVVAAIGGLNWWIDPAGDRYDPRVLTAALEPPKPCFISMIVLPDGTWPAYKLDLFRRRHARTIVIGSSRVGKVGAWPGERGFMNYGIPFSGPGGIVGLFRRLHDERHGPLTIYIGAEAFWFNDRVRDRGSLVPSLRDDLRRYLSSDTLTRTVHVLRYAPGAIRHPKALRYYQLEQLAAGCAIDRDAALVNGSTNAWAPDGRFFYQYELNHAPKPKLTSWVETNYSGYAAPAVSPSRLAALQEALAFARRSGWRVVGFEPPIATRQALRLRRSPATRRYVAAYERVVPLVFARYGFPFLNLFDVRDVPCAADAFSNDDEGHPDAECGMRIRRRLDEAAARTGLDALIASCPSESERLALERDVRLSFEHDPSTSRRCGMPLLRERAYQALRVIKALRFTRPLPWTPKTLYAWFVDAVAGVRFRGDIDTSFCCAPARTINIEASYMDALADPTHGWLDAAGRNSLAGLVSDLVHEARHAEGNPHTCQAVDDATLAEGGAWNTEIMLELWTGLYSTPFIPLRYRDAALRDAQEDMEHVCALPHANVSVRLAGRSALVRNGGGVSLAHVWLATDVGVTRDLRAVGAGATRAVALPRRARWARVVATAADPQPADNVAR